MIILQHAPNRHLTPKQDGKRMSKDNIKAGPALSAIRDENRNVNDRQTISHRSHNRFPTSHAASQGPVWGQFNQNLPMCGSDIEMRNVPSVFPTQTHSDREQQRGNSDRKGPSTAVPGAEGVASKKDGTHGTTPQLPEVDFHHNEGESSTKVRMSQLQVNVSTNDPNVRRNSENIAPLAGSMSFVPGHRSAMNSLDKIETECYNALGEDLGIFNVDPDIMGLDGDIPGGLINLESPVAKRKRPDMVEGDCERSLSSKMMRGAIPETVVQTPHLRD